MNHPQKPPTLMLVLLGLGAIGAAWALVNEWLREQRIGKSPDRD